MHWWVLGGAAGSLVAVGYAAAAVHIARDVFRAGRWRNNGLGVATFAMFASGAAFFVVLAAAQVQNGLEHGGSPPSWDGWAIPLLEAVAAGVVAWYWGLRARLASGAYAGGLYSDAADRYARALQIHDDVIQSLVTAKLALELDDRDRGMAAMEAGLNNARHIMSELIGDAPTVLAPGQLRRDRPAGP